MDALPRRILLDTNVFLIGLLDATSPEAKILNRLARSSSILIFSSELEEQLRRVSRRIEDKDWAGFVLYVIWRDYAIDYIQVPQSLAKEIEDQIDLPREDVGVYLTALLGEAECFVSANRELVKQAANKQRVFECLTAEEFVEKYFRPNEEK